MKRLLIIWVAVVGMMFPSKGVAGILPHDMPTIEALIDQHKQNMRAEDESNRQLAANATIKDMVKDVSKKYDEVKTILDKKSNDALAYLALATEMSRCVTNTVRLTKELSGVYQLRCQTCHIKTDGGVVHVGSQQQGL